MTQQLRIVPLGGLGEIGKNMTVIEYDGDAIIIDAGIMFPENDMLGIDYIIPDFNYLLERPNLNILGIIITHGHEDHTGAIGHVIEHFPVPVYATRLTTALLEVKFKRYGNKAHREYLNVIEAGEMLEFGPFIVETFHVCHSIPDGIGLGITTPVGLIVHTGDFKFDPTPVDHWPTDFGALAAFGKRGVLALLSDSTNADQPGWTASEAVIDEAFDRVFRAAPGRIIIGAFASSISRIQQVANAAQRYGRKLAFTGTSMVENVKTTTKLGYLDVPPGMIVPIDQAQRMDPSEIVIMTTGTQGEPSSILSRLAQDRHRHLEIIERDTVVMSAHPIPGNEELVHRTINKLIQRGAEVIYDPIEAVHVSGHASQEELKLMLNLVQPQFFVPVHGELRHLRQHGILARQVGIPPENIAVVENGTILELTADSLTVGERVPGGYVFVDGKGIGDVGRAVMRDREILSKYGFVSVVATTDHNGLLVDEPDVVTRGFVYVPEAEDLILDIQDKVRDVLAGIAGSNGSMSAERRAEKVESVLKSMLHKETKRRPIIVVHVNEV